jgi:hypothetical protein
MCGTWADCCAGRVKDGNDTPFWRQILPPNVFACRFCQFFPVTTRDFIFGYGLTLFKKEYAFIQLARLTVTMA